MDESGLQDSGSFVGGPLADHTDRVSPKVGEKKVGSGEQFGHTFNNAMKLATSAVHGLYDKWSCNREKIYKI